jgi:hypothetical protein
MSGIQRTSEVAEKMRDLIADLAKQTNSGVVIVLVREDEGINFEVRSNMPKDVLDEVLNEAVRHTRAAKENLS